MIIFQLGTNYLVFAGFPQMMLSLEVRVQHFYRNKPLSPDTK